MRSSSLGFLLALVWACTPPAMVDDAPPTGGVDAPVPAPSEAAPEPDSVQDPRPLVVERVEVRDVTSVINGVGYELRISLPHGYDDPERRFPVVYTLDADYSFLITRNVTDHLSERDHLREVVVVGIAYGGPLRYRLNRTRDYTPTFVPEGGYGPEYQKVSGGGPEFFRVLETEILPFVDRHYRTLPDDRTLVGHSYGGLFTLWTLFSHPGQFQRYVSVSPSIWYDNQLVLQLEETYSQSHDALPARAYLCVGSREGSSRIDMVGDLRTLAARLEQRRYEGFEFDHLVMENETHNSIFPGCLSNGLRFVLEGR